MLQHSMRAEPERSGSSGNFRSPLTSPSVTPTHRSSPAYAISRSRSIVSFQVQLPLVSFPGPLRSIFRSRSAHILWLQAVRYTDGVRRIEHYHVNRVSIKWTHHPAVV